MLPGGGLGPAPGLPPLQAAATRARAPSPPARRASRRVREGPADPPVAELGLGVRRLPDVHGAEVRLRRIGIADPLHDAQRLLLQEIRQADPSSPVLIRDASGTFSGAVRLTKAGAEPFFGTDFDPDEFDSAVATKCRNGGLPDWS